MSDIETVLAILQAASDTDSPVALMTATMPISSPGRLSSATTDGVLLEFPRPLPHEVTPGLACAVTFPNAGRTMGFLAPALDVDQDAGGRTWVTLELPAKLQPTEQRLAVRVPVPDDTLVAHLHAGEHKYDVLPLDISLDGVLVELTADDADVLEVGHRRMIELTLGRHHIVLDAEVRRQDGPRFGLFFVQREQRPKALARIVAEIGRLWALD